jgi:hypothetical protein
VKTPAEPVFGQCKLCLKQKQLHESHLMPHALYAPGKKGIQFATRSQSGQKPEHLKAHLLCFECEQRFDRLGESEVLRWLAPKARKQFPLHDRLRVALPCGEVPPYSIYKGADVGLDTDRFAYFTLSVAWRRSIHEWMNFDGTPLPLWKLGAFGEQVRAFLVGCHYKTTRYEKTASEKKSGSAQNFFSVELGTPLAPVETRDSTPSRSSGIRRFFRSEIAARTRQDRADWSLSQRACGRE